MTPSGSETRVRWIAALLLSIFAAQAVTSMRVKSTTVDEITYIAAGYYHWKTQDFEYNMTNPAVMKLVAAAPLLSMDLELPPLEGDPSGWSAIEEWQYARKFLYENTADADQILFRARLPMVGIGVLLGLLVFMWARQLYGGKGGLLALGLYSFSPNLLAHSRLATQDVGLTAACFLTAYTFWSYLERPRWTRLVLLGVVTGVAAGIKTPFVLVLPALFAYLAIGVIRSTDFAIDRSLPGVARLAEGSPRRAQVRSILIATLCVGLVALCTLNACYGFQGFLAPLGDAHGADWLARRLPGGSQGSVSSLVMGAPSPIPLAYFTGLLFQLKLTAQSGIYFMGEVHHEPLPQYLVAAMLMKAPVPSILLTAAALLTLLFRQDRRRGEWLLVGLAGVFLFVFSVKSNVSGGLRYVLPAFPCLFVLCGRHLRSGIELRPWRIIAVSALIAWNVLAALWIHPHYLAYFNEVVGGPKNGYRYLDGANLDWGQDLKLLAEYLEQNGIDSPKLAYFGSGDARYYGIAYEYLPSVGLEPNEADERWWYEIDTPEERHLEPQTGTVVISSTLLARSQWLSRTFEGTYDWLEGEEPIDQIGYSILVFDLPADEPR